MPSPTVEPDASKLASPTGLLQLPDELLIHILNFVHASEVEQPCEPINRFMYQSWALSATLPLNTRLYEAAISTALQVKSFALDISRAGIKSGVDGPLPWSVNRTLAWLERYHHHLHRVGELRIVWDAPETRLLERVMSSFTGLRKLFLQAGKSSRHLSQEHRARLLPSTLRSFRLDGFLIDFVALSRILSDARDLQDLALTECLIMGEPQWSAWSAEFPRYLTVLDVQGTTVPHYIQNRFLQNVSRIQELSLDTSGWPHDSSFLHGLQHDDDFPAGIEVLKVDISKSRARFEPLSSLFSCLKSVIERLPNLTHVRIGDAVDNSEGLFGAQFVHSVSDSLWLFQTLGRRVETLEVDLLQTKASSEALFIGLAHFLSVLSPADPTRRLKSIDFNMVPKSSEDGHNCDDAEEVHRKIEKVQRLARRAGIEVV